jgi:beta-carotene 15,15'-dioxygenase
MSKIINFAIVSSFFCLWIDSFFSKETQVIIGFLFIFSFGILHGSNDLLLIKKINPLNNSLSFRKILMTYIIVVVFGATLFWVIPWMALLLFIMASGYHFGEQQWQDLDFKLPKLILVLFQCCYGLLILLLLFVFHIAEVQKIIHEITTKQIPSFYFTGALPVFGFAFLVFCTYFAVKSVGFRKQLFSELFYLLVFSIIFKSSSLIWGFAIYFGLWHSIPSIRNQIQFLYGKVSSKNVLRYIKEASLYWIISLVGLTILYFIFKDLQLFNALFFSFLAAITFPHVFVILKMFDKKGVNTNF